MSYRVLGIACEVIKPKDVAKLHPLVNIHDLVGALHLPADAVVSPPDVNHAIAVAAARRGELYIYICIYFIFVLTPFCCCFALSLFKHLNMFTPGVQIHERTSVNHVLVEKGHVTGVETDRGPIECEYFVNCAGQVETL